MLVNHTFKWKWLLCVRRNVYGGKWSNRNSGSQ